VLIREALKLSDADLRSAYDLSSEMPPRLSSLTPIEEVISQFG